MISYSSIFLQIETILQMKNKNIYDKTIRFDCENKLIWKRIKFRRNGMRLLHSVYQMHHWQNQINMIVCLERIIDVISTDISKQTGSF